MMSKNSVLEMTLNMLVRSRNSAARVGSISAACLLVMYFSIARWIVLMMISLPLGIPTAKLYGRRYSASLALNTCATWRAIILLIAVGIPSGLSLVVSWGSLWRQNKYTSEK